MLKIHLAGRQRPHILAGALMALAIGTVAHAATTIDEHRPANSQGSVEIINVAGSIEIQGWDKPEVAVSGTIGKNVERVDVTSDGDRTSIHVLHRSEHFLGFGSDGDARLLVHVPVNSSISASLVSSDL